MRTWITPVSISLLVGLVFLAANLAPRVRYGIGTFPYPGSGDPLITACEREWGWPQVVKKDSVVEYGLVLREMRAPRYSLDHLFGRGHRKTIEQRVSLAASICNLAVLVSGSLLLVVLLRAVARRRFSLKAMLVATTAIVVMFAIIARDDPLAAWDPLFLDRWNSH